MISSVRPFLNQNHLFQGHVHGEAPRVWAKGDILRLSYIAHTLLSGGSQVKDSDLLLFFLPSACPVLNAQTPVRKPTQKMGIVYA